MAQILPQPGRILLSPSLAEILVEAENTAKRMKDEYVSVEHIFVCLIASSRSPKVFEISKTFGITEERFLSVLTRVRGNQRVTSSNPEIGRAHV